MKTKTLALFLNIAILGAMILSACAPATTPAPAEEPTPANGQIAGGRPVEITVVGMPPESNPTGLAGWKAAVARFEAKYPNVKVTGSDYAYAPDTFPALVAGNQVPTVFQAYLTDRDLMVGQGVAADLTSYYKASGLDAVYNPTLLALVSADGKNYGMPIEA